VAAGDDPFSHLGQWVDDAVLWGRTALVRADDKAILYDQFIDA